MARRIRRLCWPALLRAANLSTQEIQTGPGWGYFEPPFGGTTYYSGPEATTDGRRVIHGGEGRRCILGRVVDRDVNFQALDRLCSDHESWLRASTTCARRAPMPVISTSSMSPGFIHSGGLRLWPTPS